MATIDKFNINGTNYDLRDNSKVAIQQGSANAGKALVVGDDGNVALGDTALSDDLKAALIQLAQKVVYVDANGQQYYNALYEALYNAPAPVPVWGYAFTAADLRAGNSLTDYPGTNGEYFSDNSPHIRICYVPFDIDVESGYRYIFTWESTTPVLLSPVIYTEAIMTIINNQQTIPDYSNAIYTFGWNSGNQLTITPDAMHNGSPISRMRFNFKKGNNEAVTDGMVTSVTIRREAVSPGPGEWGYTLTTDDLKLGSYFSARPESDGSYFFDGGTLDRICYVPFDIDVESGYRYIFTWESTTPVLLSPVIYTEALMTIINNQQTIPDYSNAIYTFGWNSGNQLTITPDATYNGSPISKMRFNFKDPNNRAFTTNVVTSVTIRREAV